MKIAVLPGDGIGTEIVAEAVKVLGALDLQFELEHAPVDEARIVEHMNAAGYEAQLIARSGGEPEIVAHNCVFHHLASRHPEVCELDLALLGRLGGAAVEHRECMLRGGQVCCFQLRRGD